MGHTAVSATQASSVTIQNWQNGTEEKYRKCGTFNKIGNTKPGQ